MSFAQTRKSILIGALEVLPDAIRHLQKKIRLAKAHRAQIDELAVWLLSEPEVPEGHWFKQFGGFALWGKGA